MHLYFAPQKNLFDAPYVGVILRAEPSMDMHDLYTEHSCGYIWIQVGATCGISYRLSTCGKWPEELSTLNWLANGKSQAPKQSLP